MHKLTLKLDELAVESFATAPRQESVGTVRGNETTTTRDQVICDCQTYEIHSCDPNNCAGTAMTQCGQAGCGSGNCTWQNTCATGGQLICECP